MPEQTKLNWRHAAAAGTVALAGMALVNRQRTQAAERTQPATGGTVEINGVRLHYVEEGSGPPLLLIHGLGTQVEDWRASGLLARLAQTRRVIAFDRPGYGHSQRPRSTIWTPAAQARLIADALQALDLPAMPVVGHSWGTLVAVAMALHRPEAVSGLVLLSGYYFPTPRVDAVLGAAPAIPVVGDVMRHTVSPLLGAATFPAVAKQIFSPAEVPDAFMEANKALALRPSQIRAEAADAALILPAAAGYQSRYGELDRPLAIAHGPPDKLIPFEQSERLHAAVPGSTLHSIEGAGHMLHYPRLDAVADVIEELAARV